ncbi:hypothetical protein GCM10011404_31720 [Sphingomonas prati]|nr:hypothetical protein GCM10011404_31720 [Sphingomonas prati]
MALEDREVAFDAGDDDHVDVLRTEQLFRGDEFEVEVGHRVFLRIGAGSHGPATVGVLAELSPPPPNPLP